MLRVLWLVVAASWRASKGEMDAGLATGIGGKTGEGKLENYTKHKACMETINVISFCFRFCFEFRPAYGRL